MTKEQSQYFSEEQIKNSKQLLLRKKQVTIFNSITINDYDLQNKILATELNQQI